MSVRTSSGNARRSDRADATQNTGLGFASLMEKYTNTDILTPHSGGQFPQCPITFRGFRRGAHQAPCFTGANVVSGGGNRIVNWRRLLRFASPVTPISRASALMSHGHDLDDIRPSSIHEREREAVEKYPSCAGSRRRWGAALGELHDLC